MVVRSRDGALSSFPVVQTIHKDNICWTTEAPPRVPLASQAASQAVAEQAVRHLEGEWDMCVCVGGGGGGRAWRRRGGGGKAPVGGQLRGSGWWWLARPAAHTGSSPPGLPSCVLVAAGAGVFGVETFLLPDGSVLLNEVAPRPHNRWATEGLLSVSPQRGASISACAPGMPAPVCPTLARSALGGTAHLMLARCALPPRLLPLHAAATTPSRPAPAPSLKRTCALCWAGPWATPACASAPRSCSTYWGRLRGRRASARRMSSWDGRTLRPAPACTGASRCRRCCRAAAAAGAAAAAAELFGRWCCC